MVNNKEGKRGRLDNEECEVLAVLPLDGKPCHRPGLLPTSSAGSSAPGEAEIPLLWGDFPKKSLAYP